MSCVFSKLGWFLGSVFRTPGVDDDRPQEKAWDTTDSPTAPPAVGDDPEGLEPPPARPSGSPRESSGIDYDRLAGGPW